MKCDLHIDPEWADALATAGLGSFDSLMATTNGRCCSTHDRGQTYRVELPDGRTIFVKRDTFTSPKDLYVDLTSLRLPQPPCIVETRALQRVAELGIAAPRPIAWGQRRRAGLPWQAVLVMTPLAGIALSDLLKSDPSAEIRVAACQTAGEIAGKLYAARLSWPDLAPKHLFIPQSPAEQPGVLDLARMHPACRPRCLYMPKQIRRFCNKFRQRGGSDAEQKLFTDSLCEQLR